jgi:hypothetical protein
MATLHSIEIPYAIWKIQHTDRQTNILVAMLHLCKIIIAPLSTHLEADIRSAGQDILNYLWNCRLYINMLHNSPPLDSIAS